MAMKAESEERHSLSGFETNRRGGHSDQASGAAMDADLKALTRIVGLALVDMGVLDPDPSSLEPVACAIHSLGASGKSEGSECELS